MAVFLSKGENYTDEERQIICFGLESLEGNLLGIVLTVTIGIGFKQVGEALLLWLLLFPLRKNAGGYHAATKTRCLFVSAVILIIAFMFLAVVEGTMIIYGVCAMVAGCVIWFLAPVDNLSKKLDAVECKVYRRRTRIVLGVEGAIFILALCLKWALVAKMITIAYLIVSICLFMGLVNSSVCKNLNERSNL